ncbi:MAG: HEAT repeat domain-containing protein [Thermoguttaceae bacterium]
MPQIDEWIALYRSTNPTVRLRAAEALLRRPKEVPLRLLLDIFLAKREGVLHVDPGKALMQCADPELVPEMIALLNSEDRFVRATACDVLGNAGDYIATPHLLRMLDDPEWMVRWRAGFALASLKDSSAREQLRSIYERRKNDEYNIVWAIRCALQALGETTS